MKKDPELLREPVFTVGENGHFVGLYVQDDPDAHPRLYLLDANVARRLGKSLLRHVAKVEDHRTQ